MDLLRLPRRSIILPARPGIRRSTRQNAKLGDRDGRHMPGIAIKSAQHDACRGAARLMPPTLHPARDEAFFDIRHCTRMALHWCQCATLRVP